MNRFEVVSPIHIKNKDFKTMLPIKATIGSAGYDFYAPETKLMKPKTKYKFWTDIKVCLNMDEVLRLTQRSSVGNEQSIMLANTIGTIDSDYYGNEGNDGNIGVCLYNYGEDTIKINRGERIVQGIIFKIAYDEDEITTTMNKNPVKRIGGFGSTGK